MPLNDLARSVADEGPELLEVIRRVVDRGWFVQGPELEAFEVALASYVGVGHAIGVASGTDALELALRATGCRPGSRVLMAANAGYYAAAAATRIGAQPVYADVDPETLSLSAATVRQAIRSADCVIITHLYGRLADVEPVAALCRAAGVRLIEDCAQAIGARRGGRHAGSFGDLAAVSFYPTKNLGALGDGGAVLTDDDQLAEQVRSLRQYGWAGKYEVAQAGGVNSRLDEIQAAVLRWRLDRLDAVNDRRRAVVRRYAAALPPAVGRLAWVDGPEHVAHLAVVVCDDRPTLASHLADAGVATAIHFPVPDHLQAAYRGAPVRLPVTEHLARCVLTLPCFAELREDEIERVDAALRESALVRP